MTTNRALSGNAQPVCGSHVTARSCYCRACNRSEMQLSMHYRQLVTAGSPQSPSRAIPPSTRPHLLVCAEMQDLPEVLYQLAVNILPVVTGDPDPPVDAPIGWELTDGVIVVAYQALQRALSDCSVPVRRQQRVMSWLICFATGVTSHVDGAIAESAGRGCSSRP